MSPSIVLLPILLIWVALFLVYSTAARRDGRAPADDIGVIFLLVLALYTTLPPLFWLLQGGTYNSIFSGRLLQLQPSTEDNFYLLTIALGYALGFAAVYLGSRRRIPRPVVPTAIPFINSSVMAGAIVIISLTMVISLFLGFSGAIGTAESYIDRYRVFLELPTALRQLTKIVAGFSGFAQLVILVSLVQRWPRHRAWFVLYVLTILFSFDAEGSRSSVATGLLSVVIAWHVLVRPISRSRWLLMFGTGMTLFLILGFWRDLVSWNALVELNSRDFSLGEFDAIWANGVDLLHRKEISDFNIPFTLYSAEFFAFIPSQLLPFEKMSFSNWYLDNFYYQFQLKGTGFAFGAVSQAVVGGGFFEALIRGGLLGAISVWLIRWQRASKGRWWRFPLYLYLLIFAFQSVRDTTFRLFGDVIQIVLPTILLITIIGRILSNKPKQKFIPMPHLPR